MSLLDEYLLAHNVVSRDDLDRAIDLSKRTQARLPATLARLGLVSETDLIEAQAEVFGCPIVTRGDFPPVPLELPALNRRFLLKRLIAPMSFEDELLTIAMADPEDEEAIGAMAFAAGAREVRRMIASIADIEEAIGGDPFDLSDFSPASGGAGTEEDAERLAEGDSDAPIIRLVQRLLADAVSRRASDVHLEPMTRHLAVRYRIDGRLIEAERHPASAAGPVASRIKVMAGLDIAETRLPQDGRLRLTARGRDVDVRVATSPTAHGESVVLRLLGRSEVPLDLEKLGLPERVLAKLHRALDRPHGIILVTGPTGSGKTTTLYAAISRLRRPEVKILTVEDPVEILLEGVNQVQVRPEIDLSYAATLRAFLRQDPDILMIGEIRDRETAEIALRAALTGHLVLSTLHTNSALGAFTRLADIGVEGYLAASTVLAAISQRLVRSLCESCSTPEPTREDEAALFASAGLPAPAVLRRPTGCPACGNNGYRGRIPIMEVVEVDDRLREEIRRGTAETAFASVPATETLLGHGLALAAAGVTSLSEVRRAVQST